jgi:hypothetical protein
MYRGRFTLFAAMLAALALVPVGLARRDGAGSGYSGGPFGGSANCTECHGYSEGSGKVELLGTARRYLPGATYDLTVRITDSDQSGAGFQISAETPFNHIGMLDLIDAVHTGFTDFGFNTDYVTHTRAGVDTSVEDWEANDDSFEYRVQWQAPVADIDIVTLYAAAMAINDNSTQFGDYYYATYQTLRRAMHGDADGDNDRDMIDAAALWNCIGVTVSDPNELCAFFDADSDTFVSLDDWALIAPLFDGPTALNPAGYELADPVRGGLLYDRWWIVNGAAVPAGNHPLYPEFGAQAGSTTFRCKECHGWDYKGVDGAYGSGSHFTGIPGVYGTALPPQEMFALLKADPIDLPNGHNMEAYGMDDQDIWDVVRFTIESTVDTDSFIDGTGSFIGSAVFGSLSYSMACVTCHGDQGTDINFGTPEDPEYVGTIAQNNPWEFLHKVRFGHPGSPMPSTDLLGWPVETAANIGAHSLELPAQ